VAGLSRWAPLHEAAVWTFSPYDFGSSMAAGVIPFPSIEGALRGLDPAAAYEVRTSPGYEQGPPRACRAPSWPGCASTLRTGPDSSWWSTGGCNREEQGGQSASSSRISAANARSILSLRSTACRSAFDMPPA